MPPTLPLLHMCHYWHFSTIHQGLKGTALVVKSPHLRVWALSSGLQLNLVKGVAVCIMYHFLSGYTKRVAQLRKKRYCWSYPFWVSAICLITQKGHMPGSASSHPACDNVYYRQKSLQLFNHSLKRHFCICIFCNW